MKKTTEEQWNKFCSNINEYISSPRKEKLIEMYEKIADKLLTAPAASHSTRHNCFPGGYIDHVNRVVECTVTLFHTWQELGANTKNYSLEEAVFSAINHDLGKLGSDSGEYYIPNDSDWHVKRGQIYKINPELSFMKVPDRSIYQLAVNNIFLSENEFLAIKLHDGLYSKGNESYLMSSLPEFSLKTDLPILLHHADHLATLIESSNVHDKKPIENEIRPKTKMNKVNDPVADETLKALFSNLFEDPAK